MAFQFEKSGQLKQLNPAELAAADAHSSITVLNHGTTADGTAYWVYIAVKPSKYAEFMYATAHRQSIYLKDYGKILEFGFDKEVPAATHAAMKEKYGLDDNYMAALAEDVKKAQAGFLKTQEDLRISDIVAMLKKKQNG